MGEFEDGTCWTNRRSILWDSDFLKEPELAYFSFNSHKNWFGDNLLFDNEFVQKWSVERTVYKLYAVQSRHLL